VAPYGRPVEVGRGAPRVVLRAGVADHARPLRPQRGGDRGADPASRPGDERGLSVQQHPGSVRAVTPPTTAAGKYHGGAGRTAAGRGRLEESPDTAGQGAG